jgi:hypothetical protein
MKTISGMAILMVLFAAACVATEFKDALDEARRNVQTTDGKEYEEAFGKSFAARNGDWVARCFDAANPKDRGALSLVASVVGQKIEELILSPDTPVAACLRRNMTMTGYPAPPMPHYWVSINLGSK